jgi:hypothetical protein
MHATAIACTVLLALLEAPPGAVPASALWKMDVVPNAIYPPGAVRVNVRVAPQANLAGQYYVRITVSVGQEVVHERTIVLTKDCPASCELSFPEVRIRTDVRCRGELFLGDEFLEASEKPLALWPHCGPRAVTESHMEFWAFDLSGVIPELLPEFGVSAANATFQAVRDLGTPRVVFVGERLDPGNLQMILDRVQRTDENTVIVLLRQERFPEGAGVSTARDKIPGVDITRERASVLLQGLAARDLMTLLQGADPVYIKKRPGRAITSYVTGRSEHVDQVCSYLGIVREANHSILYCQLPGTDRRDPRQMALLHNLIQFAREHLRSAAPQRATDLERAKP